MTDITLKNRIIIHFGVNRDTKPQDTRRHGGFSWWEHFFEKLRAEFRTPFESDWESKTGLCWKDWGKL